MSQLPSASIRLRLLFLFPVRTSESSVFLIIPEMADQGAVHVETGEPGVSAGCVPVLKGRTLVSRFLFCTSGTSR
jgi:hypothetical protein